MKEVLSKMKNGMAASTSGITTKILKAFGDAGVGMLTDLIHTIIKKGIALDDWLKSVTMNLNMGKGGALEYGIYRGLILDQIMKLVGRNLRI